MMTVEEGDRSDQLRCLHDGEGLCGLITKEPDGRWRVEMLTKVEGFCPSKDEAIAFAHGCYAMLAALRKFDTHRIVPKGGER